MSEHKLSAEIRKDMGKGASRRLRREADLVPAIVYGGKEEAQAITLKHSEVLKALESESFYSQIIDLEVAGDAEEVLLKDIQRHPFKPKVLHMDFQRVVRGQELHVTVPLHFLNGESSPGHKAGGIISHTLTEVEVICRPRAIPEFIEVDLIDLDLNDTVHLKDLELPEDVRLAIFEHGDEEDNNLTVANVHRRGLEEEAEDEAEAEAAAAESDAAAEAAEGESDAEGDAEGDKE